MLFFSFCQIILSIIYAIRIITGISITYLIIINFHPITEASNNDIGIFVADHAPIKISTLNKLLPFLSNVPAKGNETYNGPAATDPNKKAMIYLTLLNLLP